MDREVQGHRGQGWKEQELDRANGPELTRPARLRETQSRGLLGNLLGRLVPF